jgi:hypothetical protein
VASCRVRAQEKLGAQTLRIHSHVEHVPHFPGETTCTVFFRDMAPTDCRNLIKIFRVVYEKIQTLFLEPTCSHSIFGARIFTVAGAPAYDG